MSIWRWVRRPGDERIEHSDLSACTRHVFVEAEPLHQHADRSGLNDQRHEHCHEHHVEHQRASGTAHVERNRSTTAGDGRSHHDADRCQHGRGLAGAAHRLGRSCQAALEQDHDHGHDRHVLGQPRIGEVHEPQTVVSDDHSEHEEQHEPGSR